MFAIATVLLAGVATAMPLVKRDSNLMGCISSKKKLTFDGNGNFKVGSQTRIGSQADPRQVVSFSDMHFGERWGRWSLGVEI